MQCPKKKNCIKAYYSKHFQVIFYKADSRQFLPFDLNPMISKFSFYMKQRK